MFGVYHRPFKCHWIAEIGLLRRTYRKLPLFAILMEFDRLFSSFLSFCEVAAEKVNFNVEGLSHLVDFAESKFQFVELDLSFIALHFDLPFPISEFNYCLPCLYC
jgi:hypothetical protein